MSNDYKKLEKAVLALNSDEKAKLIETLRRDLAGTDAGNSVRETDKAYLLRATSLINREGHEMEKLERITQQPGMMGGRACIRGLRVTVGTIVGQIGAGATIEQILEDYPYLEREDVMQALRYAAWRSEEREIVLDSV